MVETIMISGVTCLLSLTITAIFNWILNKPKQTKLEKQIQEKKRIEDKEEILREIHKTKSEISKKLEEQEAQIDVVRLGMQASLKNDLKLRYDTWLKKGYAPIDAKDDLERMYQVYHKLGANGVMDAHRTSFLALPDQKQAKGADERPQKN